MASGMNEGMKRIGFRYAYDLGMAHDCFNFLFFLWNEQIECSDFDGRGELRKALCLTSKYETISQRSKRGGDNKQRICIVS